MGTPSAVHAAAMPSIALANWSMISGRSGEPKFKQSVMPIGSAPETARLRHTSAIAIFAPCDRLDPQGPPVATARNAKNLSPRSPGAPLASSPPPRRIRTAPHHRAAAYDLVVLTIDPAARAEVRRAHHADELRG